MIESISKTLTPAVRAWIYRVLAAAGAIALFYGWLSGEELTVWLGLVATILGNVQAAAFTPAPEKSSPPAG